MNWIVLSWFAIFACSIGQSIWAQGSDEFFGIRLIDQQTGRGIPLARLRTTGAIELWTDSNGWIAFREPGLMNTAVYFSVDSPGYHYPKDAFGYSGTRLQTTAGKTATIEMKRDNLAERLYRITGQGIYRDSELLRQAFPEDSQQLKSGVIGQDSVQMVPFQGELFWLWGDTQLPNYPLGNFHTTAAITHADEFARMNPDESIKIRYFEGSDRMPKKMLPVTDPGVVWLFGLVEVEDKNRNHRLVAHYSRHLKLGQMVEHGIAVWNEQIQQFEKQVTFELDNKWRFPRGQAVRIKHEDSDYIYFTESFANVRAKASLESLLDPLQYQALTWDTETKNYTWQTELPPTTQKEEAEFIAQGSMRDSQAKLQIRDIQTGKPIQLHRASIDWNTYRQKYVMIACQIDDKSNPSYLGEIWYSEARGIEGPWNQAIKVATHPRYSFYNPRYHGCLDRQHGQIIYFEGTYTHEFSGNDRQTPRYDYNQLMYRLDLSTLPPSDKFEKLESRL